MTLETSNRVYKSEEGRMREIFESAKSATKLLNSATTDEKNDALLLMSKSLIENKDSILAANQKDIRSAKDSKISNTVIDRLFLDAERVDAMAQGLVDVSKLEDPIGELMDSWETPEGLFIKKVRVAIGVVGVIYENRPNVTADAAGLILKSGNVSILRGSSGAFLTNQEIVKVLKSGLAKSALSTDSVNFIPDASRESALALMTAKGYVDCLIPRGGPALIAAIEENATVPYIIDGAGICHMYVDEGCDLVKAVDLVVNSKAQRCSVCNSLETLLVNESIAEELIPMVAHKLIENNVEIYGSKKFNDFLPDGVESFLAKEHHFQEEFLDMKIVCEVVENVESAVKHIEKYSSKHTEVIVSENRDNINYFLTNITSAVVNVNASTRFTDGAMFGFGAEIGISTQKLHARGPMGLDELTTYKYLVEGNYATRN